MQICRDDARGEFVLAVLKRLEQNENMFSKLDFRMPGKTVSLRLTFGRSSR